MAKPILVVKILDSKYTDEKKESLIVRLEKATKNEYHIVLAGVPWSEKELPIFEVHGIMGCNCEIPLVTGDLSTKILGEDIGVIVKKSNEGRKRGS